MLQLQVYVRGKGYVAYDPAKLFFIDEIKLTNAEGWKLNPQYDNTKSWSLCLPKFDTTHVGIKDNRYFLRTKYVRVIECLNQLTSPVANYIYTNREKFGVIQEECDIKTMLIKDLFVGRTLHSNVFMDADTGKQIDLSSLKSHFRVKCYVKPVIYIKHKVEDGKVAKNTQIYMDFEIARATVFTNIINKEETSAVQPKRKIYQPKIAKRSTVETVTSSI